MKRNIKPKQIVAGSLASIIFMQSCTKPELLYYENQNVVEINTMNQDDKTNCFYQIDINLDSKTRNYLILLDRLATDIIENPSIAQEIINNPSNIAKQYGFEEFELNLDEGLLNIILFFADEDINHAIINNDVPEFIKLCNEKGLVKSLNESDLSYIRNIIKSNPDLFSGAKDEIDSKLGAVAFAVAAVVGAVVFVWAGAVTHAVTINAAAATTVWFHHFVATTTSKTSGEDSPQNNESKSLSYNNNELITLWLLKGGDNHKCKNLTDANTERFIDEVIETIANEFPENIQNIDLEELKNTIILNINREKL